MYDSVWHMLFQVFIQFMLQSIALKEPVFDNICPQTH